MSFLRVLVAGHAYTTLTWYYGGKRPSYTKRQSAYEACRSSAYVLVNGDTSTLQRGGFATVTGEELWPGSQNLVHGPKDTCCYSVRNKTLVQLKRPTAEEIRKQGLALLLKVDVLSGPIG